MVKTYAKRALPSGPSTRATSIPSFRLDATTSFRQDGKRSLSRRERLASEIRAQGFDIDNVSNESEFMFIKTLSPIKRAQVTRPVRSPRTLYSVLVSVQPRSTSSINTPLPDNSDRRKTSIEYIRLFGIPIESIVTLCA